MKNNSTTSQKKVKRCCPDEGWDTTGLCSVLVRGAGVEPCAGHAGTKVGVLRGIGACPLQVIFNQEPGLVGNHGKNLNLTKKC